MDKSKDGLRNAYHRKEQERWSMSLQVQIKKKLKNFTLEANFEVEQGTLGILGASGCGKSMTLKSIAGLVTPEEGRIVVNGTVFFDSEKKINLSPQKRKVGYLFQNYALFPNMTVEENIMAGLSCIKQEKEKKVKEMIALLHLEGLEKQYPNYLSGGQQQRVALARVLAYDPEVILLDEPFSALDSYLKEQLQMQLKEILAYYHKTVLMVSHDRSEIYRLTQNTMTMKEGKILQIGSTKQVFEAPKDPITARLVGCRNLSMAKRIDDFHVKALEWNMIFETKQPVPESVQNIGMHEQGFVLKSDEEVTKDMANKFSVEIIDILEEPKEYHVLVRAKEELQDETVCYRQREIWCIVSKEHAQFEIQCKKSYFLVADVGQILFF